jgi:hypothetical protein
MSEEIEQELTLDDLDYYWMSNGLPVFMANREDICEVVEYFGFNIYYLLGNIEKTTKTTPPSNPTGAGYNGYKPPTPAPSVTVTTSNMQLFKVVNNFIGRTVTFSTESFDPQFIAVQEEATYNMPPIPHVLVDKLDQFFRLVDAQHGSESIVMLTYDLEKEGSEGWGILVPDQTNTSVHCNYDPNSIAEVKPDNVMIVGSVHSHPGMSAYASGTDHKDQADFDGIHITFGWQKSVQNGATQYYAEMQMSGQAYKLDIEDVFEDYVVEKAPDPEVVAWTGKVKKALPPSTVGGSLTPVNGTHQAGTQAGTADHRKKQALSFRCIPEFNLEDNAIIVAELDDEQNKLFTCPSCQTSLDEYDIFDGSCCVCDVPIAEKNTNVATLIDNLAYYCTRNGIDKKAPAYLWCRDANNADFIIRLTPTTLLNSIFTDPHLDDSYMILENTLESVVDDDIFTVCCGRTLRDAEQLCYCKVQILTSDFVDFEEETKTIQVYDLSTGCANCEFFYDTHCPEYIKLIEKFVTNRSTDIYSFEEAISIQECNSYLPYSANIYNPLEA